MHAGSPASIGCPDELPLDGPESGYATTRNVGIASLLRRRWLVGLCGAGFLFVGILAGVLRPASYTASSQLLVYVRELRSSLDPVITPGRADNALVQNQIEILRAPSTLSQVVQALDLTTDPELMDRGLLARAFDALDQAADGGRAKTELAVQSLQKKLAVRRVGTSHTILLSATASTPEKAARIANEVVRQAQQQTVNDESESSRSMLLRERLQGLGPRVYVMSPAAAPIRPDGPRRIIVAVGALGLGLLFGAAIALLLDYRDGTVRKAEQVKAFGLELVGFVPRLLSLTSGWSNNVPGAAPDGSSPYPAQRPQSMFRRTLQRIDALVTSKGLSHIALTSVDPQAGVTTIAERLALLVAQSGRRVLLVRAIQNSQRLQAGAVTSTSGEDQPQSGSVAAQPGLDVIRVQWDAGLKRSGPTGEDAADVMESRDNYDLVIADLPANLRSREFSAAARQLKAVMLILEWGRTDLDSVRRSVELFGELQVTCIGAVLNRVDERMLRAYGEKFWAAEADYVNPSRWSGKARRAEQRRAKDWIGCDQAGKIREVSQ